MSKEALVTNAHMRSAKLDSGEKCVNVVHKRYKQVCPRTPKRKLKRYELSILNRMPKCASPKIALKNRDGIQKINKSAQANDIIAKRETKNEKRETRNALEKARKLKDLKSFKMLAKYLNFLDRDRERRSQVPSDEH
jgi:hypothetical protein